MLTASLTLNNARTGKPEHLGTVQIVNTGEGTEKRGVYRVTWENKLGDHSTVWIEDWPRQSLGAWALLHEAITVLDLGENL